MRHRSLTLTMLRLSLGCGIFADPDWFGVDVATDPAVRADWRADIRALPFRDGVADRAYLGHVCEHLPLADVPRALLEVRRVLRPGGALCVVGPDRDRAVAIGAEPSLLAAIDHGTPTGRPDDVHHWACTEAILLPLVRAVFPDARPVPVEEIDRSWPVVSRARWQVAIVASRT